MRSRLVVIVVAILLVAAFAALNWSEFVRPTELLFGPIAMDAPLGLLLLGLLGVTLIAFLVTDSITSTRSLIDSRHYHKTLEAQRELADKAELSRFTELRNHLDTQLRELRQRDAITAAEFEKAMVTSQREMRTQFEQMNRTLAARLTEMEHRFDRGQSGLSPAAARPVMPAAPLTHEPVEAIDRAGHLRDESAREQRAQEERLRDANNHEERLHNERAVASTDTTPRTAAEQTGWRRWF